MSNTEVKIHPVEKSLSRKIEDELMSSGLGLHERIAHVDNTSQFALRGLSMLVVACSQSADIKLKESVEGLLPFANDFLKSGSLVIDVLGMPESSAKVMKNNQVIAKVVKDKVAS